MTGGESFDDLDFEDDLSLDDDLDLDLSSDLASYSDTSEPVSARSARNTPAVAQGDASNLLLAGAVGLFLSGILPVVVFYQPDTGLLGGGLGDTFVGVTGGYWQVGVISFFLALLPAVIAITTRGKESSSKATLPFFLSLGLLLLLVIPIVVLGSILAVVPWSGVLRFVKHSGFRVEVGPGAWLAIASAATMLIASARMMTSERLEALHFSWLVPRRQIAWIPVTIAVVLLVGASTMRVIPWVSLTGTFKGVLPYLGPINWQGDINWPVGFLPVAGAFEFVGLCSLAAGLFFVVLRSGVLGPLLFTLGGWLILIAAGIVGSTTISGPTPTLTNEKFFGVVVEQLDATVSKMTIGVVGSVVFGIATVLLGLKWLSESRKELLGD